MIYSANHSQLGAGEVLLKEPVAQVDGEINLVWLGDLDLSLSCFQVNGHEFVANFRSVLCVILQAEILLLVSISRSCSSRLVRRPILLLTLLLLGPSNLIKALAEQDHVREHGLLVIIIFDFLRNGVQIESEYFIDFHAGPVRVRKILVVPLLMGLSTGWLWLEFVLLQMQEEFVHWILIITLVLALPSQEFLEPHVEAVRAGSWPALTLWRLEVIFVLRIPSLQRLQNRI